jgi:hypothetical protein
MVNGGAGFNFSAIEGRRRGVQFHTGTADSHLGALKLTLTFILLLSCILRRVSGFKRLRSSGMQAADRRLRTGCRPK